MDGESLPTDPARAQDHRPSARLAMQTDRRDDASAQPERCAVGLGLVADLDGRIDRIGGGASQDRSVVEQHRRGAVVIVVREPIADQRSACIDRRSEIGLLHERDLTGVTRGVSPWSRPRRRS